MSTRIEWGNLLAFTPHDVTPYAPQLAAAYNINATMLGNTQPMTAGDVIEHYAALQPPAAHPFVLLADGDLAGDGDLRGITGGTGEFAFLIALPSAQGKGLGTRFAIMVHAFAFRTLELRRLYASVIPANTASLRVFEKLGYAPCDEASRGDDGDIVLGIDRAMFEERHGDVLAKIRITS
jgi:RimJ/RimL family protein N-acetyltransferase